MPRTQVVRNFRTADVLAGVDAIDTGTEASNSASIARFTAGGVVTSRRWAAGSATGPSAAVPTVGTAFGNQGWRETAPLDAGAQTIIEAITHTITLRCRRSGQTLEVDQNSDVTVILYRADSSGGFQAELGRATVRFTWTTTATDRAFAIALGATTLNPGDRFHIEVYVVTLNVANVATAPAVATDLILQVGASTDSRISGFNYTTQFTRAAADDGAAADVATKALTATRALADASPAAEATTRALTAARTVADSAPADDALVRVLTGSRALADSAPADDALERFVTVNRAFGDSAPASDAVTRAATFPREVTDTAPASDAATRQLTAGRNPADDAPADDAVTRATVNSRQLADSAPADDSVARQLTGARSVADSAPADDATTRQLIASRNVDDSAPASDDVVRATVSARQLSDAAPADDAATRALTAARSVSDSAPASDATTRGVTFNRAAADAAPADDAVERSLIASRALADTASASDALERFLTYGRNLRDNIGPSADDPVDIPTRKIEGVVRDSQGNPINGAIVKLFRQGDDRAVQQMTTAANGVYLFMRDLFDTNTYFVISYKEGTTPQLHGVSDRDLEPVDA